MKLLILSIMLSAFNSATASVKKTPNSFVEGSRYRGVQCKIDNSLVELKYCNVKAYSRKTSFLNVGVRLLKSFDKPVYVQVISNYQFESGYREIINTGKQEWCSIMEESSTNQFMKIVIEVVKSNPKAKEVFKLCPYTGELDVQNFSTLSLKYYDSLPAGLYRIDLNVFKDEKLAFSLKLNEEIKKDLF